MHIFKFNEISTKKLECAKDKCGGSTWHGHRQSPYFSSLTILVKVRTNATIVEFDMSPRKTLYRLESVFSKIFKMSWPKFLI